MENIRQIAKLNPRYSEIVREERNYAAVLYHALMDRDNLRTFLSQIGITDGVTEDFGVYFEYSMLRDLWNQIDDNAIDANAVKRDIIRGFLRMDGIADILQKDVYEINRFFGVAGNPSRDCIQYPGRWAMAKYDPNIPDTDNEGFLRTCRFKWAFNIKPDLVIHLSKDRAVCIEAKYESGEGSYPGSEREKAIFKRRGLPGVGQLDIQRYMMTELLGIQTDFVYLVFDGSTPPQNGVLTITWREAFLHINTSGYASFLRDMLRNVQVL